MNNSQDYDFAFTNLHKKYNESMTLFLQYNYSNENIPDKLLQLQMQLEVDFININTVSVNNIENIKQKLTTQFKQDYVGYMHNNIVDRMYKSIEWMKREYIFYQILILTSKCITDQDFFNIFIKKTYEGIAFRDDICKVIQHFKIGIYGSKNITSDIDVSISYNPYINTNQFKNRPNYGIAYVVNMIENMFIYILNIPSLILDIEIYADYTLTTKHDGSEYFYLDVSTFTNDNFIAMLPVIFAGIIRNYIKGIKKIDDNIEIHIIELFTNTYSWKGNLNNKIKQVFYIFNNIISQYINMNKITEYINNGYIKVQLYNESNDKTQMYFEKSRIAELDIQQFFSQKQQNIQQKIQQNNNISNIICAIGESLICREEGYISPLTIMDIVYNGQKYKQSNTKYSKDFCTKPDNIKKIHCLLGKFGYIISMMEQLGYLIRFYLIYSNQNTKLLLDNKTYPKIDKYLKRFEQSLDKYNSFIQQNGGRNKKFKSKIKHKKK